MLRYVLYGANGCEVCLPSTLAEECCGIAAGAHTEDERMVAGSCQHVSRAGLRF